MRMDREGKKKKKVRMGFGGIKIHERRSIFLLSLKILCTLLT